MLEIRFNNVGQGDSIIIEWSKDKVLHIGIIDCHVYNGRNPTLEYLKTKTSFRFEFIILSHFHEDHFSGMADIFNYCIDNNIKVCKFYHSLTNFQGEIYNRIFTSQKLTKLVKRFIELYESLNPMVEEKFLIQKGLAPLQINPATQLEFLAPVGVIYDEMARQLSRKKNKITTTIADINKLATIILIKIEDKAIILTSDAVKRSYQIITGKVSPEIVLAQAPHHGSWGNVEQKFWNAINHISNCPIVFSVGDEPKDQLPDFESVQFFDNKGYYVQSTNNVYGIASYFGSNPSAITPHANSALLNTFSTLIRQTVPITLASRFSGDQVFQF